MIMLLNSSKQDNQQLIQTLVKNSLIYCYRDPEVPSLLLLKYKRDKLNSNIIPTDIRKCRGLIVDQDSGKEVCHSFDMRMDYREFSQQHPFEEVSITPLLDGTMVNLYYYKNKWMLSTKSRISALKSKWNTPKSFQELFEETTELLYDQLDTDVCYSFILIHRDNQIIIKNDMNYVYLVLARNMTSGELVTEAQDVAKLGTNIYSLPKVEQFTSYQELDNHLDTYPDAVLGFMLNAPNGNRARIHGARYKRARELKGNDPNLIRHLLHLIQTDELEEYLQHFPQHQACVDDLNRDIKGFFNILLKFYFMSRNHYIEYPNYISKSIYNLHHIYIENKKKRLKYPNINFKRTLAYFNSLDSKLQYYLLNIYISRKKDTGKVNKK